MIYERLDTIPMAQFIEVLCGNVQALVIGGEETSQALEKKAKELRFAYYSIVNGKETKARLYGEDRELKVRMRLYCLAYANSMVKTGNKDGAVEVVQALGYTCTVDDVEKRIANARRELEFLMGRMKQEKQQKKIEKEENAEQMREGFMRERAFLMTYHKMYIDIRVMSAAEYAGILALTDREINIRMRALKKKK